MLLSREQEIDEAAKRTRDAYMSANWTPASGVNFEHWRQIALAAQMPIAPLEPEEMDKLAAKHDRGWLYPVESFIAMRNAPPKPDLEAKVYKAIIDASISVNCSGESLVHPVGLTKRIVAIMKEQQ